MIKTIEDFLLKARISWVISVDDDFSPQVITDVYRTSKIHEMAADIGAYTQHIGKYLNIDSIIDLNPDQCFDILRPIFLDLKDSEWESWFTPESEITKLQLIVEEWEAARLIKGCLFVPTVAETLSLLKDMPHEWEVDKDNRILWLIDRDFTKVSEGNDAGLNIIQYLADSQMKNNICLLLTANEDLTLEGLMDGILAGGNVLEWFNLVSIVSKSNFLSSQNSSVLISQVLQGLWNNYNHLLICQMAGYLLEGTNKAKVKFLSLSPTATRNIVINYPSSEGTSVPETILRILNSLTYKEFGDAYSKEIDEMTRLLVDYSNLDTEEKRIDEQDRDLLFEIAHSEKYDKNVNVLRQAIGFGDIFKINSDYFILFSQPCDIAYRGQSGRYLNDALLVKILKCSEINNQHTSEPMKYFIKSAQYQIEFREFRQFDFNILDLCAMNLDGTAMVSKEAVVNKRLNESEYEVLPYERTRIEDILKSLSKRYLEWETFTKVGARLNTLSRENAEERDLANKYKRLLQKPSVDVPREENSSLIYPIQRICRLKEPFSVKLYSEFTTYHSRIGVPGDYVQTSLSICKELVKSEVECASSVSK